MRKVVMSRSVSCENPLFDGRAVSMAILMD